MPWSKEKRNEYQKAYAKRRRIARREAGVCSNCGKSPPNAGRKHCPTCAAKIARNCRRQEERCRDRIFAAYGGPVCACCGEAEAVFLTLDHINNDGAAHKRAIGNGVKVALNYAGMYTHLRRAGFPPGLQVLCWNCNCGKHRNGGVCPHKSVAPAR